MTVPMKRRAYVKITGLNSFSVTTMINSKDFTVPDGRRLRIDLVTLKPWSGTHIRSAFYLIAEYNHDGRLCVSINYRERDRNPEPVGYLSIESGYPREGNFYAVVMED